MSRITAIEPLKKDPSRVGIYLDGKLALELAAILTAWLGPGQDLDESRIAALRDQDVRERAYEDAVAFLARRVRSDGEIRQYLRRRRVAPDVIEQTLDRLHANRLADDQLFTQAWIENRTTFRPRSRRALSWELKQKGVPEATVQAALAGLDDDSLAYQAGQKRAARFANLEWDAFRSKLTGFLARRGFSYPVIATAVSRLWSETHAGGHTADTNEDTR